MQHQTARSTATALVLLTLLAMILSGCSTPRLPSLPSIADLPLVYKIDIQQGNVIEQEMLAQLQPGMNKAKVRFIMGSPLIVDTFHKNRWDYLYSYKKGRGGRSQRRITLFFEDEKLAHLEGDIKPALGRLSVPPRRDEIVDVPEREALTIVGRIRDKVGLSKDKIETAQDVEAKQAPGLLAKLKNRAGLGADDGRHGVKILVPADGSHLKDDGFFGRLGRNDKDDDEESSAAEESEPVAEELSDEELGLVEVDEEVVIPADAPVEPERGFLGRLLGGFGRTPGYEATDPRYQDPTDPDL